MSINGPEWDLSSEYNGLSDGRLASDLKRAETLIADLAGFSAKLSPLVARAESLSDTERRDAVKWAQDATKLQLEAMELVWNVETFLSCELSVDAKNASAKTAFANVQAIQARLAQANNAVDQFLKLTSETVVKEYLSAPHTAPTKFLVQQDRKLKDQALSLPEEDILIGLSVDGPTAWGNLYDNLSGTISCDVALPDGNKKVGLAATATMLQDGSEDVRKAAWRATNAAWEQNEESAAAILNALSGWRHTVYQRRSAKKPVHYLDPSLHGARIERKTLDAMMGAVAEARPFARKSLTLQAKVLGKPKLAPWDLFSPCPVKGAGDKIPYREAIDQIVASFGAVNPDMGAFVKMMDDKQWIEGRVAPNKRPGAYCTGFVKSRTPRVYMTYSGGMREFKTLAHELGHAFHSWVMRDMPVVETFYPMTLAETASIFGETLVNHAMLARAKTQAERLAFCWSNAREVDSLLLNIPARFEFETRFYDRRKSSTLSADDLRKLMVESWQEWYGDALSEMDPMFWASKLHFSIASVSFYNYPYTFGYLFALGVYAQRDRLGDRFYQSYVNLLRDTGRMTAEEVAAKHLGADLTRPDFWRQSLAIAKRAVDQLEEAVKAI